jgi:hypothetical protein
MQPNNEGEKVKGRWVLCAFFFLGFVLWWVLSFLFFYIYVEPIKFFFTTNFFVITYKLNIIEGFYHKVNDFTTVLVFLSFFHSFK